MKKQRTILLQSLIITFLSFATFTAPAQQIANGTLLYRPATSYMLDEDGRLVPSNVLRISKSDYVNSFNVGFYGLPESLVGAKSVLANVEFERFVSNRASVAVELFTSIMPMMRMSRVIGKQVQERVLELASPIENTLMNMVGSF